MVHLYKLSIFVITGIQFAMCVDATIMWHRESYLQLSYRRRRAYADDVGQAAGGLGDGGESGKMVTLLNLLSFE